jgi:RNA recognition motif-containing protein
MPAPRFRGNVVVWNLPAQFTEADLAALFDEFGLVLSATVKRSRTDPDQASQGLVDLAPAKAIENAVRALNGCVVAEHKLKVRKAPDLSDRPRTKPAPAPKPLRRKWPAETRAPAAAPPRVEAAAPTVVQRKFGSTLTLRKAQSS